MGKEIPFNLRCKKNKNKTIGSFLIFRSRLVSSIVFISKGVELAYSSCVGETNEGIVNSMPLGDCSESNRMLRSRGEGVAIVGGGGTATIEEVERGLETERNIPRDSTD